MSDNKNIAVFGIYESRMAAERAVDEIKLRGFRNTDVSVLLSDDSSSKEFAHEKNTKAPEGTPEYEAKRFEGLVKDGGVLLSVHCDDSDWVDRAKNGLEATGAKDISSTGEATSEIKVDAHNRILPKDGDRIAG